MKIAGWLWANLFLPLCVTLGIGALASQALEAWLRQRGYIDHPENLIAIVVAWLGDQTKAWWLIPVGAMLPCAPS